MANTKSKTKPNTKAAANTKPPAKSAADTIAQERPIVAKDVDPNQFVTVRNGFQGRLVYKSGKTGERFVWDEFGAEQEIELRELRNAKSAHKKMFENNWFMFDEDWIIDYLGVRQYYKNAVGIDGFDAVFSETPADIKKIVGDMTDGQKKSVSYRARQLILDGEIDSRKTIATLEEVLGTELVER